MSVERVTPKEANERMSAGHAYLDVRSIPEFEQGHPTGAYNIPLMHMAGGRMVPNQEFLAVVQATFGTDAKIVVGCKSGGRSLRACEILAQNGYTHAIDVRGGFGGEFDMSGVCVVPGWLAAELPVSTTPVAGRGFEDLKAKKK